MLYSGTELKRFKGIAFVLSFATAFGANAGSASSADIDRAVAEQHFRLSSVNLHNADRFPDGAKGYTSYSSDGYSHFVETPSIFKTRSDFKAHLFYCSLDAIVIATYVDSEPPVLTSNKAAIYTASHFVAKQVIKGKGQMIPGATIVTYRPGGEVADAGEVLRVSTPNAPSYRSGRNYLLFLSQDKSTTVSQYIAGGMGMGDEGTTSISDDRVYPSLPNWVGFRRATPLADVSAAFSRASQLACN